MRTTNESLRTSLGVVGLFAGIGGLELGLERAGHRTLALCEIDPHARQVLQTRFPGVEIRQDVRNFGKAPAGTDVVCGGSPCTDFSQAGRTAGIRGAASSLVSSLLDVAEAADPRWILLENVPNLLHLRGGEAIETIAIWLETRGYSWAYRVVDTRSFGLPHRRRRMILLASRTSDPRRLLADEACPCEPREPTAFGFYWTEGTRGLGWAPDAIPTLKGGSGLGIPSPPAIWRGEGGIGLPSLRDAERLQGFPPGWTSGPNGQRWKMLGNAVSVPLAQYLGELLGRADEPWQTRIEPRQWPLSKGQRWPDAAYSSGQGRFGVAASEFPVATQTIPIESFLEDPLTPLSARATAGFLRRARASRLRFHPSFLDAVARHLEDVSGQ